MGTKIEYSINLLATSVVDSNNFTGSGVDVWEHYQNKGVTNNNNNFSKIGDNKLQDPMEKMHDRNSIESIKKTIQIHEDIFKHQVRELHRVYSVQKTLMDELKNENRQENFWTPMMNSIGTNHPNLIQQLQTQTSYVPDFHLQNLREGQSSKERSGSCSGETNKNQRQRQRQRGFDLERSTADEYMAAAVSTRGSDEDEAGPSSYTAFQRCQIGNDGSDEDMEVDLTLSIGSSISSKVNNNNNNNNNNKNKKKCYLLPLGLSDSNNGKDREIMNSSVSFQSDRLGDCSDPTTPMSSSSVTFDQERKGHHWLSQGLKLK